MQIKVQNGVVDLSGEPILKKVDIEINTESKIGVVGRNGCGKTTLLRLLCGELKISKDTPPELCSQFIVSGKPTIGTLNQMAFKDNTVTLLEEIRSAYSELLNMQKRLFELQLQMELFSPDENIISEYTSLLDHFTNSGGFYFEKEYEAAIKRFGFTNEEKNKPLSDFSGGQRTKIAFLKLLLSKPDLLLLDEPTNHLDLEAVTWLEEYLSSYKKAVVIVSHDRMFLDKTVTTIYEIEHGKTYKYDGNYSEFSKKKEIVRRQQAKDYEAQQKEIAKLNELIERFRYKATKAAMVQSKIKYLEHMEKIDPPDNFDLKQFHADFEPDLRSVNDVLTVRELEIGYTDVISKLSFSLRRGQHVGIVGGNGKGKSTLLKTIVGTIPKIGGSFIIGGNVKLGYFDQQMAQYSGTLTLLDDFMNEFPGITTFEARSALGAFLFSGEDVFKTVDMLSGGEKVRLALCKMFRHKPNLLILDEPTNHMDIVGKEALESILMNYSGTLLFVSHDRYFVKKVAHHILSFENNGVQWYEYGYDEYTEKQNNLVLSPAPSVTSASPAEKSPKKSYSTPLKDKSKRERALKKAEELVEKLENEFSMLEQELQSEENLSNYLKLEEIQAALSETADKLESAMEEWERLANENET